MKLEEAIDLETKAFQRRIEIRRKKCHDYAKEEDILSNFKEMAHLAKILRIDITTPHGVAMWHLVHKMVRVCNLWSQNKEPENESLEDTHDDLANYNDLAKECYMDYQRSKNGPREAEQ